MLPRIHRSSIIIACLMVASVGCAPGQKFKTVPVSGKVTYKGAPVDGATVAFLQESQAGVASHTCTGQTDAQGVYKLMTFETPAKPVDGAIPGKYMVTVTKYAGGPSGSMMAAGMDRDAMKDLSPEDMKKMGGQAAGVPDPGRSGESESVKALQAKAEIPERYGRPKDSGLEAEVKESGPQTFDFELKE